MQETLKPGSMNKVCLILSPVLPNQNPGYSRVYTNFKTIFGAICVEIKHKQARFCPYELLRRTPGLGSTRRVWRV